ncbi:MAG: phosphoenolpyruvate carboxykinase (ATP) [Actinobacteria bacterium]|nr:phosphoenolpyruvate carboxykinase (ATP) [Actinomycetota bacterium]
MPVELPTARSVTENPPQQQLRSWVDQMSNAVLTEHGNYSVTTRVTARSAGSTYVVTDAPAFTAKQTMSRADHDALVRAQDAHIGEYDMILIRGFIGPDGSPFRVPAQLYIERSAANVSAMQEQLYFPPDATWDAERAFTVIYTPSLPASGYPDERVIAIDLDHWVTRVSGADYFGESKMGSLRMWNQWVYEHGGLAMHSGAKVIPTPDGDRVALIVGLSGTGKTTTTFTRQNDSLPVQDDFVALATGGAVHSTENGCFAKTFSLDPAHEPTIHAALTSPGSWLENVAVHDDGTVDFADASHTKNGRGTFALADIPHHDPRKLGRADFLLILNRNDDIVPAVTRLTSVEQAVAYFMLGETRGTSAGGKAEAGRALRVPGTNPFFLEHDYMQGNRLGELIRSMEYDFGVYVLNTGAIGGADDPDGGKEVEIAHSSAIVRAIAEDTIRWTPDPDFEYWIAEEVDGIDDPELLNPRLRYAAQGREEAYSARVAELKCERAEYLAQHEGLDEAVPAALG